MSLQLDIVTPERSAFSGEVPEVTLPAWEGELGVLPGHDQLLALLVPGIAKVGGGDRYVVGAGFAEIGPDRITLLADSCQDASTVDKTAAKADLAAAEAELVGAVAGTEKHRGIWLRVKLAQAQLSA
jgi:F-type H+-transporting ATPase subunit epsilon